MLTKHVYPSVVLFFAVFLFTSCRKDIDFDFSNESTMAFGDAVSEESQNISDEAVQSGSVSYKNEDNSSVLSCATVTRDTLSSPRVCTIDFGTGCTGPDGRTRSGKIIVNYTGAYKAAGTVIDITHDNFVVDGKQILTERHIENVGYNNDGKLQWNVAVDGHVIQSGGQATLWTSQKSRVMEEGEATATWADDVYAITGTSSGTLANGRTFTAQSLTPLIRKMLPGCRRHFVQGQLEMSVSGRPVRVIDFGTGACDNTATVTVNGTTFTIQF